MTNGGAGKAERSFYLPRSGGHEIYAECYGNPRSEICFLYFHGGPGDGFSPSSVSRFDLDRHYVIFFDQRGAGRSRFRELLEENTTEELLSDAAALADVLGRDRLFLYGASWGATLALLFALRYPERCRGLALRSVFLPGQKHTERIYGGKAARFRPQSYARLCTSCEPFRKQGEALHETLARVILEGEEREARAAAQMVSRYWRSLLSLGETETEPPVLSVFSEEEAAALLRSMRIAWHYIRHAHFLEEGELLRRMAGRGFALNAIRLCIQCGARDLVCPPEMSAQAASVWPGAELELLPDAGHRPFCEAEEEKIAALIRRVTQ